MRLISVNEDGYGAGVSIINLQSLDSMGISKSDKTVNKFSLGNQNQVNIQKSELPKEVSLPINFFEKMKNIYLEPELR